MTVPVLDNVRRQQMLAMLVTRCEMRLVRLINDVASDLFLNELICVLRDIGSMRAIIAQPGPDDQRSSARMPETAVLVVQGRKGAGTQAALWDISAGGALIELDGTMPVAVNDLITISVPGLIRPVEATVIGVNGGMVRLCFRSLNPDDVVDLIKHIERHSARY